MTVYVGIARRTRWSRRWPYMWACHMVADSRSELMAMVDEIGVQRRWIQHDGTYRVHFDITASKRRLALKAGAVEITGHDLGLRLLRHSGATLSSKP